MGTEAPPNVPHPLPASLFAEDDFVAGCPPEALIYFLINIGDGDTQLLLMPERAKGGRRAVVVDVGATKKLPTLVETLASGPKPILTDPGDYLFPLVVATHPHNDHIAGMPEFLDRFKERIRELWEPGYYHTNSAYIEMMRALEDSDGLIQHTQPTSGTTRYVGRVRIQVLAPSIALRNRFDSYGINLNNASLALKVEFPASGVEWNEDKTKRQYVKLTGKRRRLLLGGDSQTLSWGKVLDDFATVETTRFPASQALQQVAAPDPLRAEVFKVPHHGSKHGVNIELVEAIDPGLSLISSVPGGGEYNFPHILAQEAVREALDPVSSTGRTHKPDWELGIHYTGAVDDAGKPLGTIALVIPPTGTITMWRFSDRPQDDVDLAAARRYVP